MVLATWKGCLQINTKAWKCRIRFYTPLFTCYIAGEAPQKENMTGSWEFPRKSPSKHLFKKKWRQKRRQPSSLKSRKGLFGSKTLNRLLMSSSSGWKYDLCAIVKVTEPGVLFSKCWSHKVGQLKGHFNLYPQFSWDLKKEKKNEGGGRGWMRLIFRVAHSRDAFEIKIFPITPVSSSEGRWFCRKKHLRGRLNSPIHPLQKASGPLNRDWVSEIHFSNEGYVRKISKS